MIEKSSVVCTTTGGGVGGVGGGPKIFFYNFRYKYNTYLHMYELKHTYASQEKLGWLCGCDNISNWL